MLPMGLMLFLSMTFNLVFIFHTQPTLRKNLEDAYESQECPETITEFPGYKELASFYIKVDRSHFMSSGYQEDSLGQIKLRSEIDPEGKMSEDELLILTGYTVANGDTMNPLWDIVQRGVLDGVGYGNKLPDLRTFKVRRQR